MKVLVVDDELVSRSKMKKIMENFADCEEAENGESAVSAVRNALESGNGYTMMTLDISMPDMNGVEVLKAVRSLEEEKGVEEDQKLRIMMVTSHHSEKHVLESIKAGCDNFIVKPFNKETVKKRLVSMGFDL